MDKNTRLYNILKLYNNNRIEKDKRKEIIKWHNNYVNEINDMYIKCVNPKLEISYDDFVELLFKCTIAKINLNTFKKYKPMI